MEPENRNNQKKYYLLTYSDGRTPEKVVYGWPAVMAERKRTKAKVSSKGFHTEEVAIRYLNHMIDGSVTFQNAEKSPRSMI